MGGGTGKKSVAPDPASDAGAKLTPDPQKFKVPYDRNLHFTGRSRLLDELHQTLMVEGVTALNQMAAIAGLGGISKTQTAVEYAYRSFFEMRAYEWVFWVTADTELTLVTGLADIGRSLNLREGTLEELATQTKQWLLTHDRWLLIFDNADESEIVKPWLPRNPHGHILLTSRAQQFVRLGIKAPIVVPSLTLEASLWFLFERTGRPVYVCNWVTKTIDLEFTAAEALARALDGLPLALEQAAAYIQQTNRTFAVYWQYYQQQQLTLLERGKPETGDYPKSIATTWLLNFQAVAERSPASGPLLQLSAVLAPDGIPEWLLLQGATALGLTDCTDDWALGEQLGALANFSLIQREPGKHYYQIHRMVQAAVWHQQTPTDRQDWLHRAVAGLNAAFPYVEFDNWAVCGQLVPHVQAVASHLESETLDTTDWALLLNQAGYYLHEQGRYAEAEPLYGRSLQIKEQQLGSDHPDTARCLWNLAALHYNMDRVAEAKPLITRAVAILEHTLGSQHPDTLNARGWWQGIHNTEP
ncbi:MAG: tetratricopeptide repeat protein [Lyngbya sp. HA4199-MV5]|jgi:tetratricopeptide (TPR) repeat protein|nr:tetratricopeptide repeat protein [Lyngbya sp. HA4199-MV5]